MKRRLLSTMAVVTLAVATSVTFAQREGDRGPGPRGEERGARDGARGPRDGDRRPQNGARPPRDGDREPRDGTRPPREGDRPERPESE